MQAWLLGSLLRGNKGKGGEDFVDFDLLLVQK